MNVYLENFLSMKSVNTGLQAASQVCTSVQTWTVVTTICSIHHEYPSETRYHLQQWSIEKHHFKHVQPLVWLVDGQVSGSKTIWGVTRHSGNMAHILFPTVFMVNVILDGGWDPKTLHSSSPGHMHVMQPLLQWHKSPTSHRTQSMSHLSQQSLNV
jgi:hypothetical protein